MRSPGVPISWPGPIAGQSTACLTIEIPIRLPMRSSAVWRRVPIGVQAFRTLREDNCSYVDKTGIAVRLVQEGTHYFLSRPRRFGKSLFLDTLKELFEGNRALFEGLRAYERWDWSVRHPVVRLSFGKGNFRRPGYLHVNLRAQLDRIGRRAGVRLRHETGPECFDHLIRTLHAQIGQRVVVLIDERDKPIPDARDVPEIARSKRDDLRGLYATIKDRDAHVRLCFLTGVSRFSKASLFSGLNNLRDITPSPRHSSNCGYKERDLESVFAARDSPEPTGSGYVTGTTATAVAARRRSTSPLTCSWCSLTASSSPVGTRPARQGS